MSDHGFCSACQAFLRGSCDAAEDNPGAYIHHPSAESFALALESRCELCTGLWADFRLDDDEVILETRWTPSRVSQNTSERNAWELYFWCTRETRKEPSAKMHVAVLALEPIGVQPGPCGKLMEGNSGSRTALSFFASQYQDCRTKHASCKRWAPSNKFMPQRLIDVGSAGHASIRLCESNSLDISGDYVTLSHCWGGSQPYTLTKSTAEELATGISITELPKTFQDAITAARSFQFRYLWIDSLCIFQDNLEEWHIEAGRMREIYGNAACCIAATSAEDSNVGLFFDRNPQTLQPIVVEVTWATFDDLPPPGKYWCSFNWIHPHYAVDCAPLNKRAWVAQERHLSPRIMHFAKDALFWECLETFGSEACPRGFPDVNVTLPRLDDGRPLKVAARELRPDTVDDSALQTHCPRAAPAAKNGLPILWRSFLRNYTRCSMTRESDCLIAISGITQDIGRIMDDQFVAGLWRNRLLEELCWTVLHDHNQKLLPRTCRPAIWRAPSWSWASSVLGILPGQLNAKATVQNMATVLDVDVDQKPSGELIRASMVITCRPIPIILRASSVRSGRLKIHAILENQGTREYVSIDDPNIIASEDTLLNVWLILLWHTTINISEKELHGLVISNCVRQPECFERIGLLHLSSNNKITSRNMAMTSFLSRHEATACQSIVLL